MTATSLLLLPSATMRMTWSSRGVRPLRTESPRLVDIPYSVMKLFGHEPPRYMQGRMIFPSGAEQPAARGMLDPRVLSQSGAAPGALVFPAIPDGASSVDAAS